MKKRTIIALIVAGALLLAGTFLLVMGLSLAKSNPKEITMNQQDVLIQEPFESVQINTVDCDVHFMPYNGDVDAQVTILEQEAVKHDVWVEDGTLKIKMIDERNWTDHIGVFGKTEAMKMTVYLPNTQYTSVRVTTDTGDIRIPGVLMAEEILVRSDTGDVWCEGGPVGMLDCMVSTGDITVRGGNAIQMKLRTDTGDVDVSGLVGEELHLASDTGETNAENVTVKVFSFNGSTGDVELEKVMAEDYLQIFTDSGDVEIENSDGGNVNIETNTGDVSGHFLTAKWFSAHSDTGNVNVPNTPEGGDCRIETDTGDIRFW